MTQHTTTASAWTDRPSPEEDVELIPADDADDAPDDTVPADADPATSRGGADPFEAMRRVDPEGAERLRQEWGAAFDANLERARHAAAIVADDELIAVLEETGLGDDPRIVRAAARIGALVEARDAAPSPAAGGARAALEDELDRLMADPDYWTDRVQRRVRRIHIDLHGGGALPVHRRAGDAGGVR